MNRIFTALLALLISFIPLKNGFSFSFDKEKRSYLYVTGSSTISPLMASVSEEFSRTQNLNGIETKTPHVESIGTRNGFISFCEGIGYKYPDFVNASRHIDQSELDNCKKHGVNEVIEIKIGYDGIILGNFRKSAVTKLTKEQIFLALAEKVVDKKTHKIIDNPYKKWSEIDPSLPNRNILIYGPPATSGTRDVFIDMVMEESCFNKKEFVDNYPSYESRKAQCSKIRSDGKFIESGENDDLIVQNLKNNPDSLGILGFHFLVANQHLIKAVKINGIDPNFNNISSKKYQLSRPLFVYFKKENLNLMPQMKDFIKEIINPETIGKNGYLVHSGLVPLTDSDLEKVRNNIISQLN